ncbi:glutamate synthase-related protein [Kocuria rhizophila]|nr:glutamate synthase-related protein [Kocuria rhizophila]
MYPGQGFKGDKAFAPAERRRAGYGWCHGGSQTRARGRAPRAAGRAGLPPALRRLAAEHLRHGFGSLSRRRAGHEQGCGPGQPRRRPVRAASRSTTWRTARPRLESAPGTSAPGRARETLTRRCLGEKSHLPQVKAINIKLSRAPEPGLGGVLPRLQGHRGDRGGPRCARGQTCISPASHSAFAAPRELIRFVARLRSSPAASHRVQAVRGLARGDPRHLQGHDRGGGEPGLHHRGRRSRAAPAPPPLECQDHVGTPLVEGLILMHDASVAPVCGSARRAQVRRKITSGHDVVRRIIQGADFCMSARAMMMAVGCIQAQACRTNECPWGSPPSPALQPWTWRTRASAWSAPPPDGGRGGADGLHHRLRRPRSSPGRCCGARWPPIHVLRDPLPVAAPPVSCSRASRAAGVGLGCGPDRFSAGHPGKYVFHDRGPLTPAGVIPRRTAARAAPGVRFRTGVRGGVPWRRRLRTRRRSPRCRALPGERLPGGNNCGKRPEGEPGTIGGRPSTPRRPGPRARQRGSACVTTPAAAPTLGWPERGGILRLAGRRRLAAAAPPSS